MKLTINRIVKGYQEWLKFCELSGFDHNDEELYNDWVEATSEEELDKMSSELTELCEDNEVIKKLIQEYLASS